MLATSRLSALVLLVGLAALASSAPLAHQSDQPPFSCTQRPTSVCDALGHPQSFAVLPLGVTHPPGAPLADPRATLFANWTSEILSARNNTHCALLSLQVACWFWYPPCVSLDDAAEIERLPACQSSCAEWLASCSDYIAVLELPGLAATCSALQFPDALVDSTAAPAWTNLTVVDESTGQLAYEDSSHKVYNFSCFNISDLKTSELPLPTVGVVPSESSTRPIIQHQPGFAELACVERPTSQCDLLKDHLPPTFAATAAEANSGSTGFRAEFLKKLAAFTLSGIDDAYCSVLSLKLACWWSFPPCARLPLGNASRPVDDGGEIQVERVPVCRGGCSRWSKRCPEIWNLLNDNKFAVDCDNTFRFSEYLFAGGPVAWHNQSVVDDTMLFRDNAGAVHEIECFDIVVKDTDNLQILTGECSEGLFWSEELERCMLGCPLPVHTDDQRDTLDWTARVASWINLVAAGFIIVTYCFQPAKRKFPARFVIYFSICLLSVGVAMALGRAGRIRCASETEFQTGAYSPCGLQSFFFIFGSIGMSMWWVSMVLALYLMIVKDVVGAALAEKEWMFHAVCWPASALFAAIPGLAETVRFNPGGLTCFISSEGTDGSSDVTGQVWLFAAPQSLILIVGFVLFVFLLLEVRRTSQKVGRFDTFNRLLRMVWFSPFYFLVLTVFLVYTWELIGVQGELYNLQFEGFQDCLFDFDNPNSYVAQLHAGTCTGACARELYDTKSVECRAAFTVIQNFTFDVVVRVALGCIGILVFVDFGATSGNWQCWRRYATMLTGSTTGTASAESQPASQWHADTVTAAEQKRMGTAGSSKRILLSPSSKKPLPAPAEMKVRSVGVLSSSAIAAAGAEGPSPPRSPSFKARKARRSTSPKTLSLDT